MPTCKIILLYLAFVAHHTVVLPCACCLLHHHTNRRTTRRVTPCGGVPPLPLKRLPPPRCAVTQHAFHSNDSAATCAAAFPYLPLPLLSTVQLPSYKGVNSGDACNSFHTYRQNDGLAFLTCLFPVHLRGPSAARAVHNSAWYYPSFLAASFHIYISLLP